MLKEFTIQSPVGLLQIANYESDKSITPQLANGVYEPHVQAIINLITKPDSIVLDLGANVGIHSILFSKLARNVTCVKASPENVEVLKYNFTLNGLDEPKVLTEFLGGGETLTFSRAESNHACSFTATTDHSQKNEVRQTVVTKKLHEVVSEQPTIIKMDIEGAELNVMKASPEIFERAEYMIVELNKFTNERFFNQPIKLLTDHLLTLYKVCILHQHQLFEVGSHWLDNYFASNVMLDVLCVRKSL